MRWTDVAEIAIELADLYPKADVLNIRFTDLQAMVLNLPGFDDAISNCNEKVLEAIQAAWLEEIA